MRMVEATGKSVEEAVEKALMELGRAREQVEVEVLEEPSKGLLGILGSKMARVRVRDKGDIGEMAEEFVQGILERMGIKARQERYERDGYHYIRIYGSDVGLLIGRRGETLNALQYLVNLAVGHKAGKKAKVILDIEGYRERRQETLIRLARRMSERVRRTGMAVALEPMNPQERRVIHTALHGDSRVYTISEGEEPYRKVVIRPKR